MAPSSSAKKVAKLASRGKGRKVRFQSGTTFPTVVAAVMVVMIGLIAYAKASMPGAETGDPQPGTEWVAAYSFRLCDTEYSLTGSPGDESKDASTGDTAKLQAGNDSSDGVIHYHPQTGGATGRKAKLGVFLDIYGVKITDTKIEFPASQSIDPAVWDTKKGDVFKGTSCEGKTPVLKVRVWNDYTSNEYSDKITDFRNLRFTKNGMVFVIAVVPDKFEIPKPDSAARLQSLGAQGTSATTTTTGGSTPTGDTTVGTGVTDTTAATDTTAVANSTTTAATSTTGG